MSEKPSEKSEMSSLDMAAHLVKQVVPTDAGATITARIGVTARRLGWSHTRISDVWYRQARRIDSDEMDALRKEAGNEFRKLTTQLARLEMALEHQDADFHRTQISALREHRRFSSLLDSAGTEDC